MARHPEWFERLDVIVEVVRQSQLDWIGRREMKTIFGCSERDSIRLLHKFGTEERNDALSLPRSALLAQIEAIRSGSTYGAFRRQRENVAQQLGTARAEAAARQFRVASHSPEAPRPQIHSLPSTITWRRSIPNGRARFEILYADGADLMRQLSEFLSAAGVNREEFFAGTEPTDGPTR
jgi:hypothetical protein